MQHQNEKTNNSRPSRQTPSTVSVSGQEEKQHPANHRTHRALMPKQLLNGADLCSRFDQMTGQGLPKRMTTGKFVYLGPIDRLPDSPL